MYGLTASCTQRDRTSLDFLIVVLMRLLSIYLFILAHAAVCRILVPQPRIEPALEAQSLNH